MEGSGKRIRCKDRVKELGKEIGRKGSYLVAYAKDKGRGLKWMLRIGSSAAYKQPFYLVAHSEDSKRRRIRREIDTGQ